MVMAVKNFVLNSGNRVGMRIASAGVDIHLLLGCQIISSGTGLDERHSTPTPEIKRGV
jgi:hypothetical protein